MRVVWTLNSPTSDTHQDLKMFALVVILVVFALSSYLSAWYLLVWLLASFAGFISLTVGSIQAGPWLLISLIGGIWLAGWWAIPIAILSFVSGVLVAHHKNRNTA